MNQPPVDDSSSCTTKTPWQLAWKNPTWCKTTSSTHEITPVSGSTLAGSSSDDVSTERSYDTNTVGVTSALVESHELSPHIQQQIESHDDDDDDNENDNVTAASSLVLSVTLLSSSSVDTSSGPSSGAVPSPPPLATSLEIELLQTISSVPASDEEKQEAQQESTSATSARSICTKTLQWPASIHLGLNHTTNTWDQRREEQDESSDTTDEMHNKTPSRTTENGNVFQSWWSSSKAKLLELFANEDNSSQSYSRDADGVVAAALCRLPDSTFGRNLAATSTNNSLENNEATADALDVVSFLSLALAPPVGNELDQLQSEMTYSIDTNDSSKSSVPMAAHAVGATTPVTTISETPLDQDHEHRHPAVAASSSAPIEARSTTINPSSNVTTTSDNEAKDTLRLVCVTARGDVYIYSPWKLLFGDDSADVDENDKRNDNTSLHKEIFDDNELSMGIASILFGPLIHETLQHSFLPLCQPLEAIPISSVEMSSLMRRTNPHDHVTTSPSVEQKSTEEEVDHKAPFDYSHNSEKEHDKIGDQNRTTDTDNARAPNIIHGGSNLGKEQQNATLPQFLAPVWDPILWNPVVEPSTYIYRTTHNIPTHCCPVTITGRGSDGFIAIAGRGTRVSSLEHQKRLLQPSMMKEGKETTNAGDSFMARSEESTPEEDTQFFKEKSSPGNWWEEDEEQTNQDSTTHSNQKCDDSSDEGATTDPSLQKASSPSPDRRQIKERGKTCQYRHAETIGGFVTFISLRYYSETRTVFLPFEPLQISPFQLQGMSFLMVLGKDSVSEAVAIRIDASSNVSVSSSAAALSVRGDTGAIIASNERPIGLESLQIPQAASSVDVGITASTTAASTGPVYYIRRFQLLPIEIPTNVMGSQAFSSGRFLLGGSTTPGTVQPPGILVAYSTRAITDANSSLKTKLGNDGHDSGNEVWILQRTLHRISPLATAEHSFGTSSSWYSNRQNTGPSLSKSTTASALFRDYRPPFGSGPPLQIDTTHYGGHIAQIRHANDARKNASSKVVSTSARKMQDWTRNLWSYLGQGWCLVGTKSHVYFICWEGSTPCRGSLFVEELKSSPSMKQSGRPQICTILPLPSSLSRKRKQRGQQLEEDLRLPFTQPYQLPSIEEGLYERQQQEATLENVDDHNVAMDEIVVEALESIRSYNHDLDATNSSSLPSSVTEASYNHQTADSTVNRGSMSHREKSRRLLQQCSSWTQLEATANNRMKLEGQVPVLSLRLGRSRNSRRSRSIHSSSHYFLTFRKLVIENGPRTHFQEVLSWLSNRNDYFTAASIALDLLRDAELLFHLWKHAEKIDEEDEQTKLEGLLDGIQPIMWDSFIDQKHRPHQGVSAGEARVGWGHSNQLHFSAASPHTSALTQLADMTVGCLTKGGFAMSKTLEKFLRKNEYYDAALASLMLVATAAKAVSDDPTSVASVMGNEYSSAISNQSTMMTNLEDVLWPVRCLLEIGVSRNYISTALILLNVTIPDELRGRKVAKKTDSQQQRHSKSQTASYVKALCTNLVTLIVESSPVAADLLLGLVDEQSRCQYWHSLDHQTRLDLCLIEIKDQKCPLLRHPEVRAWARHVLNDSLQGHHDEKNDDEYYGEQESKISLGVEDDEKYPIPTHRLQQLCVASLKNAGCDLMDLCMEDGSLVTSIAYPLSAFDSTTDVGTGSKVTVAEEEEMLQKYINSMKETRRALIAPSMDSSSNIGSLILDFDILVPCLLLLECRNASWSGQQDEQNLGDFISTRSLLDAVCYLNGRSRRRYVEDDKKEESPSMFPSDNRTLMKQCALADNVRAGANLIGGMNGFVLICCDILMQELGMTMDTAESFLLDDSLPLHIIKTVSSSMSMSTPPSSTKDRSDTTLSVPGGLSSESMAAEFKLNDAHRQILCLLDEHVLSIRTYGEFDTIHIRGRVDPVFAARSLFRVWFILTLSEKIQASAWLVEWLRLRLGIMRIKDHDIDDHTSDEKTDNDNDTSGTQTRGGRNSSTIVSKHRLACAAIVRALIWPSNDDMGNIASSSLNNDIGSSISRDEEDGEVDNSADNDMAMMASSSKILANEMGMESKFLLQLAQSCCGLVESIPLAVAEDILLNRRKSDS